MPYFRRFRNKMETDPLYPRSQSALSPVHPMRILPAALLCQICAGTTYWFPALVPSLYHLNLSASQQIILVATANSGSTLGIIGGMLHQRLGSRITAIVGALSLSFLFSLLQLQLPFFITWIVVFAIPNCSYMLYAPCIALTAAVFPKQFRGRVVGCGTACYGASAGVFGAIQASFFPHNSHHMLMFCSAACLVPALIAISVFPTNERYGNEISDDDFAHAKKNISFTYAIVWILVASLQISAIAEVNQSSSAILLITSSFVVTALALFPTISIRSTFIVHPTTTENILTPDPPFWQVARDIRYVFICLGALLVIGGAGVPALVQTSALVQARFASPNANLIRAFVIVFSACNVMARLGVGSQLDIGRTPFDRLLRKFNIMRNISLVMAAALLGVGVLSSWGLYIAFGLVGACEGAWFAVTPALTTVWFGVQSFPKNFAWIGLFVAIASATLASTVPVVLMKQFGEWNNGICKGVTCTLPTFGLLAILQIVLWMFSYTVRRRVVREAMVMQKQSLVLSIGQEV